MLLKDLLKEVFNKASLENDILIKENIIIKWVHRFGLDSLNDLLRQNLVLIEEDNEEGNEEQINLIEEDDDEVLSNGKSYEDIILNNENEDISENKKLKSESFNYMPNTDLPLPNINYLRKWINNDKKAS